MSERFESFGLLHCGMVVAALVSYVALIRHGRRVVGTPGEARLRRWLFVSILAVNLPWGAYLLSPPHFDVRYSLPLQLCDFSWILAAWSIAAGGDPKRTGHETLFYWGLGLAVLGFITPTVTQGPRTFSFWAFWLTHWQILAVALLNLCVFGVRPGWRSCLKCALTTAAIAYTVMAFNVAFGTNYFFTGDTIPDNPTPIDSLGPWPTRVVWITLIVWVEFAVMTAILNRRTTATPR